MHFNGLKPCRRLPVDRGWAWVILMAFLALNCLSNILSCRTLIMIGSILSALCFILDSLASSTLMLSFSHLLNGAGIAFIYGPCFVNIGHYFKRYRGTANAFASCGASVGQFLFSPLVILLISEYGIKGALFLNSAIFLQCTLFAMFLRPISFYKKTSSRETNSSANSSYNLSCTNCDDISNKQCTGRETETHENIAEDTSKANSNSKDFESIKPEQEKKKLFLSKENNHSKTEKENLNNEAENDEENGLHKKDLFSFRNFRLVDGEESEQDDIICSQMERKDCISVSSSPGMNKNYIHKKQSSKCWRILSKVDFKLFKKRKFLLYFFAAAIGQNASISPQTYFPPHAEDIGLGQKEGAYFVAIAGFADLGGRILTTLIADKTFLNRPKFLGLVLFSHGIIGCFIPLYKTFGAFSVYCIYYGAAGGILFAISPTILTDFVGERRLSQGFGLVFLFNGLLSSIYYPVLGYLRDLTESYNVGYGINSVALIFSGVLFLTEACMKHKKSTRK